MPDADGVTVSAPDGYMAEGWQAPYADWVAVFAAVEADDRDAAATALRAMFPARPRWMVDEEVARWFDRQRRGKQWL
jgi:hypothetical protein